MPPTLAPHEVLPPSERKFGFTFAGVFLVIALLPALFGGHLRWWAIGLALVFFVLARVAPHLLKTPNLLWFRLGLLLHKIVNPLVLGALFLLVVTPLAIIMRLLGKKLLNRSYDPTARTYWIAREPPGPEPESIHNQF